MTWHLAIGLLIKTHETEQSDFRRVIIFASASSDSALHWNNILYLTFLLPSQPLSHSPHRPLSRSMCYFLIYIYIFIQVSFHSLSLFMLYYFFTSLKLKALYIFVYLKVLCSCETIPSSTSFYYFSSKPTSSNLKIFSFASLVFCLRHSSLCISVPE